MRGYGRSSTYTRHEDFAQELIVEDMLELLASLGREQARCGSATTGAARWCGTSPRIIPTRRSAWRAFACPISPSGFTLENVVPLVDRKVYPEAEFPAGQWDYQFFYEESFDKACKGFEANIRNVVKALFRKGDPEARRQARADRVGAQVGRLVRRRARVPTCRAMPTSSPSRTWRPTPRR